LANAAPDSSSAAAQEIHVKLLVRKEICIPVPLIQRRTERFLMLRVELEANSTHALPVVSYRVLSRFSKMLSANPHACFFIQQIY
jgi:hypothetical protein